MARAIAVKTGRPYPHLDEKTEAAFRRVVHGVAADWLLPRLASPHLIRMRDLADILDVEPTRVRQAVKQGILPVRRTGSTRMIVSTHLTPEMLLAIRSPQGRQSYFPEGELVYFIGQEGRFVKIGYSNNFAKRYEQLQGSSPFRLRLLVHTPGDRALEKEYHRRFVEHRTVGEWFNLHPDIKAEIARLQQQ